MIFFYIFDIFDIFHKISAGARVLEQGRPFFLGGGHMASAWSASL